MNLGHYEIPYEEWHRVQAVIDAARAWVDNEDCIGDCGCGACDQLHDAVRALDGDQ